MTDDDEYFVVQAETRVSDNERLMIKLQQEVDRLEGKTRFQCDTTFLCLDGVAMWCARRAVHADPSLWRPKRTLCAEGWGVLLESLQTGPLQPC